MTKKLKPLPKNIPSFKSHAEAAAFWDTHDTSSLLKKKEKSPLTFSKPVKHLISIRIDLPLLKEVQKLAELRHIPYQTLIRSLLAEKLSEIRGRAA